MQPMFVIPTPQKMCDRDFDYKQSGRDWGCNCNEGTKQSPINLPEKDSIEYNEFDNPKPQQFSFEYKILDKDDLEMFYFANAIRIRPRDSKKSFGLLKTNNTE